MEWEWLFGGLCVALLLAASFSLLKKKEYDSHQVPGMMAFDQSHLALNGGIAQVQLGSRSMTATGSRPLGN